MRVLISVLVATSIAAAIYFFVFAPQQGPVPLEPSQEIKTTNLQESPEQKIKRVIITSEAVFVPYWADMDQVSGAEEDRLFYFGVSVDEDGVVKSDVGYNVLDSFVNNAGSAEKYLTVRMLDAEMNTRILKDSSLWPTIAESIVTLAVEKGFDGVVLDLEVGLIAFHIDPDSITGFTQALKDKTSIQKIPLAMTIYGDTFYRKRPYDVKALGEIADEMMIMAYDFHKSFGTPGPNFPLNGREVYNYDFTTMMSDFTTLVEPEKLSVLFGMYGYEWTVDEQERPTKAGTAITLNQIEQKFYPDCTLRGCEITKDKISAETKITYTGNEDRTRIVWFEDRSSVESKKKVVEEYGVSKIGYWAFGYY